ncbi:DUF397 domain-containing protein [Actinomadura soli]|uniref:DUF397 domain-containing protein n=1 Tax=Actinomadura soli TaxID=2508997 RepID=A0A5C4J8W2_9ACTN|nr:DUF397 domain-containing protein [Actinomadura soli]TMQ96802.1 DUF397 domain-containing protein [Actinomadura soli]
MSKPLEDDGGHRVATLTHAGRRLTPKRNDRGGRPSVAESSRSSGDGGAWGEVAGLPEGIGVRDGKDPDGPNLVVQRDEFAELVAVLKVEGGSAPKVGDVEPRPLWGGLAVLSGIGWHFRVALIGWRVAS